MVLFSVFHFHLFKVLRNLPQFDRTSLSNKVLWRNFRGCLWVLLPSCWVRASLQKKGFNMSKVWIRFHPPFTVPSVMFVSLHKNCWVKLDLLSPSEDGKLPRQAGAQQPGRLIDQVLKQVPGKDCSQTFFSHRLQRERLITGYSSR